MLQLRLPRQPVASGCRWRSRSLLLHPEGSGRSHNATPKQTHKQSKHQKLHHQSKKQKQKSKTEETKQTNKQTNTPLTQNHTPRTECLVEEREHSWRSPSIPPHAKHQSMEKHHTHRLIRHGMSISSMRTLHSKRNGNTKETKHIHTTKKNEKRKTRLQESTCASVSMHTIVHKNMTRGGRFLILFILLHHIPFIYLHTHFVCLFVVSGPESLPI
mmetsp:Transcript_60104/g.69631  ORF Transcript_60104/g.69631 Transcript_60104/m.69631 type:complete len:215 (-) Transcript_60104:1262-1906(-)